MNALNNLVFHGTGLLPCLAALEESTEEAQTAWVVAFSSEGSVNFLDTSNSVVLPAFLSTDHHTELYYCVTP